MSQIQTDSSPRGSRSPWCDSMTKRACSPPGSTLQPPTSSLLSHFAGGCYPPESIDFLSASLSCRSFLPPFLLSRRLFLRSPDLPKRLRGPLSPIISLNIVNGFGTLLLSRACLDVILCSRPIEEIPAFLTSHSFDAIYATHHGRVSLGTQGTFSAQPDGH